MGGEGKTVAKPSKPSNCKKNKVSLTDEGCLLQAQFTSVKPCQEKMGCRVSQQGEEENTAFATTFRVLALLLQRQPRGLTGIWHMLLRGLGHPWWDLPTKTGAGQAPPGQPVGTSNTREASQGSRWREDVSSAFFRGEIQNKNMKFAHSLTAFSCGTCPKSGTGEPGTLSCRSRGIIRVILWATLLAEGMSRRSPF